MDKLDLRGVPCPANAAKALIRISTMDIGEQLEIWLQDGEPIQNLVPALSEAGHRILSQNRIDPGNWSVVVEVAS